LPATAARIARCTTGQGASDARTVVVGDLFDEDFDEDDIGLGVAAVRARRFSWWTKLELGRRSVLPVD
jgi:hypothetical protein